MVNGKQRNLLNEKQLLANALKCEHCSLVWMPSKMEGSDDNGNKRPKNIYNFIYGEVVVHQALNRLASVSLIVNSLTRRSRF